ncbi:hypothetical protein [Chondrinema litorale]|uniref:hypothetical protein n=1 Tax=Chondrinema litorale TaxID=2994555 RepID=UPI002543136B|nr:hypothetical protein [Chondrinema litorale]UZR93039.1 hypothetical protein OQ292_14350 [Chondrinema litorale]
MDIKKLDDAALKKVIDDNKIIYNEYLDLPFAIKLNEEIIDFLANNYFRVEYIGFDDPPERNTSNHPLIFTSNHSGMAFPWDGIIFLSGLFKKWNYQHYAARPLIAPMLTQTTLMNPFLIPNLWKKAGSIDANMLNFETMMQHKDYNLLIYPEGVPGIGKGFNNRYQLQKVATSFVRMSLKYKTDLIPFYTINGEFINPYHYTSSFVDKLINIIKIPFLPLGALTIVLILQPWLFYYAMPAKLYFVRGKRISPYKMIADKPYKEYTQQEIEKLRDELHVTMQSELTEAKNNYGKKPYQFRQFLKVIGNNFYRLPFLFPTGWPVLFSEFYRKYKKYGANGFKMKLNWYTFFIYFLKNPFVIFYFIPIIGWIPILIKGYKKSKTGEKHT